jgi:hypothetical protein
VHCVKSPPPGPPEPATPDIIYSIDGTSDVDCETGPTLSGEYHTADSTFTSTIYWIRPQAGTENHDHLIDPQHLLRVLMNRQ